MDILFPPVTTRAMRKTSINQANRSGHQSVYGRKHNHCVIFPSRVDIIADALERTENCWFVRTNAVSDLIVKVGESSFHLHKLPMVSRSGFLNRLVFHRKNNTEANTSRTICIDNFPGGYQIFQLVVKFCYGLAVDLTAVNVAPVYCAAHFLEMTEDFGQGNLLSKAEAFISFIIFSSWKGTIHMLKSCEDTSIRAGEFGIVKRCSESIAWKACIDPQTIGRSIDELRSNVLNNKAKSSDSKDGGSGQVVVESWWSEDVSVLRIDHFVEVINSLKVKRMKPRLVGSCITYWTSKWLKKFKLHKDFDHKVPRGTFESLIRVLPSEKDSVCCNFLLHLLKVGLVLNIDCELTMNLERRVATMLENHCAGDLLVKNYKDDDTVYDVRLVIRLVDSYVIYFSRDQMSRMDLVARVVDEYLALVARDENLSIECFQLLAEALPENARQCNDRLYRAVDMYLKAHPTLTEMERRTVCRAMEYQKLSQEARNHAMKNNRLPLSVTLRLSLWEHVNMTKSILSSNLNYMRSKSQEIIRVTKGHDKRWFKTHKKLQTMKAEVEKMKMQLSNLQDSSLELQRQVSLGPR